MQCNIFFSELIDCMLCLKNSSQTAHFVNTISAICQVTLNNEECRGRKLVFSTWDISCHKTANSDFYTITNYETQFFQWLYIYIWVIQPSPMANKVQKGIREYC